jgi:TatA/E family protein of Tat protein translocase
MSIGIWQIALVGLVLALLFGSRKLPALGADLAKGIKDLRHQFAAKPAPVEDAPFEEPTRTPGSRL